MTNFTRLRGTHCWLIQFMNRWNRLGWKYWLITLKARYEIFGQKSITDYDVDRQKWEVQSRGIFLLELLCICWFSTKGLYIYCLNLAKWQLHFIFFNHNVMAQIFCTKPQLIHNEKRAQCSIPCSFYFWWIDADRQRPWTFRVQTEVYMGRHRHAFPRQQVRAANIHPTGAVPILSQRWQHCYIIVWTFYWRQIYVLSGGGGVYDLNFGNLIPSTSMSILTL